MNIKLKNFFKSSILVSPEKALTIYGEIADTLKSKKEVILDFDGIKATTLVFLFVLFTRLWKEFGKELKNVLSIKNASESLMKEIIYLEKNYKKLHERFHEVHNNFQLAYLQ
ncbi:STAS-like domain-containing protein [Cetobacterium sp. SF1]|uniref:STAS-like domain-containing protein n=1 Tax=unclassified Cetobacterium TaxID=2630983 RepID=UPI003CF6E362